MTTFTVNDQRQFAILIRTRKWRSIMSSSWGVLGDGCCSRIWWHRADSKLASSQWETSLQSNAVSHWLGANLESALIISLIDPRPQGKMEIANINFPWNWDWYVWIYRVWLIIFNSCCEYGGVGVQISSLTHWGRVTHICVSEPTSIGSDNGLSPGRRQAIIWTNAGILLTGPLGINFSEIVIEIQTFSLR